jgi:hypothetical protein
VGSCAASAYFAMTLPAWVATGFAVACCFVFRQETEELIHRYWECLRLASPSSPLQPSSSPSASSVFDGAVRQTAWGAAAAVYQSITLVATLLLVCHLLLLAGLAAAGRALGAGAVAERLLRAISSSQLLSGLLLGVIAASLHSRSDGTVHADAALLCLALIVVAHGSLGLAAAHLRSPCLLRLHSSLSTATAVGLVCFVAALATLGVQGLASSAFLSANWHRIVAVDPRLTKEAFVSLLHRHWTKLLITASLLTVVQLVVLAASCVLRDALARKTGRHHHGLHRLHPSDEIHMRDATRDEERAGLISGSDDNEEPQPPPPGSR